MRKIHLIIISALFLISCQSTESEVESTVKSYYNFLRNGEFSKAWTLVSSEDQNAKSQQEFTSELTKGFGALAGSVYQLIKSVEVTKTEIKGKTATVTLAIKANDPIASKVTTSNPIVKLVLENRNNAEVWLIDESWAEDKIQKQLRKESREKKKKADNYVAIGRAPLAKPIYEELLKNSPNDEKIKKGFKDLENKLKTYKAGYWSVTSETDKMTDDIITFAQLYENDASVSLFKRDASIIMIRCTGEKLDIYIATDNILDFRTGNEVKIRWGTEPAVTTNANKGSSSKSLFIKKPKEFISKMLKHEKDTLKIEVNYISSSDILEFPLNGIGQVLSELKCY